ncbi:MAG: DUF11 domain-containing protein, partial [Acidimicrobiales bacterium]
PHTYTFTLTNLGPDTAFGVTFSDVVSPGLAVISASSTAGSCTLSSNTEVDCALGDLASGAAVTISVTVVPLSARISYVTDSASAGVGPSSVDPDTSNNSVVIHGRVVSSSRG